jgi:proline iminopeptidase
MRINKRREFIVLSIVLVVFCSCSRNDNTSETVSLWPSIEPFQIGFLQVSNVHEIYYEVCGNPEGKPVFVIHGGPGGGCSPDMRRFFNPEKYLIVLHDQRGCGKSTTQFLVDDIELLRKKLKLEQIILFGGSWGSTLSLAYAETYPENVSAMVLRGVFLGGDEDINNIMVNVVPKFFPVEYNTLFEALPDDSLFFLPATWLKKVQSNNQVEREAYTKIISRYEYKASGLHMDDEMLDEYYNSEENYEEYYNLALMEMYYFANNCFLEKDQLLMNAYIIEHVPTTIVNGRYDMVCPPYKAYKLHNKLPDSKLIIVEKSGHLMSEKGIETELLRAMIELE